MQYRNFKGSGEPISLLGFGTMRLPVLGQDSGRIDEPAAIDMIRKAIDNGVNYVDTAFMYHNGNSEVVTGKALKDGYREKVFLADKFPFWMVKEAGGIEALFEKQFERLDVDHIDFYLVHALEKRLWDKIKESNLMTFLEQKKAEGRIGRIGFSFHDEFPVFEEIINDYPWEFCQIQLNYMDLDYQAGLRGLKLAEEKGIPAIVMEPLKGGKLTISLPETVRAIFENSNKKWTPAEWALRYVADFPNVLTILSGMGATDQVEENIRILSDARPKSLSGEDYHIIQQVAEAYRKLIRADCTGCRYCIPCSVKIPIPDIMDFYNQWHIYKAAAPIIREFRMNTRKGRRPSDCTDCAICEERCPQHLPIRRIMKESADLFEV